MSRINVAIDGPAGAGKSTIARAVAKKLGILYLDTGAMYRALALKALRKGLVPGSREDVIPILADTEVTVRNNAGTQITYLDGEDVSQLIRTQEVSKGASDIAVIPEVRIKLAELQRNVARENDVVMDGRDICTYVMPHTKNKFYVTASVEERARRRLSELNEKGEYLEYTLEKMRGEIASRDHTDSTREFAPLTKAPDAIVIDTTCMSIETAIETLVNNIRL
ncbi:MAG TPA: (d)CMP kinase [Clostridia bacterium]|jgi:cytidylate kinase|nr:(d)CMP kinase [Clostridia bacterium]